MKTVRKLIKVQPELLDELKKCAISHLGVSPSVGTCALLLRAAAKTIGEPELGIVDRGRPRKNPIDRTRAKVLKPGVCSRCGWNVEPGVIERHHKDRNRRNNAISNIEYLCPNCHQTDHFRAVDGRYKLMRRQMAGQNGKKSDT